MKPYFLALTLCLLPALSQKTNPFAGRWDFTVTAPDATYPSWMEVTEENGAPKVRVQGRSGSVRPVADVKQEGGHLLLTMGQLTWDLESANGQLTGTQKRGDRTATLAGVPAPALKRSEPKAWSRPEPLFNGRDLTGWEPDNPKVNHWVAQDGVLLNQEHGANLKTTRKFDDFQLHIEFNCPEKGNSGIYLRGRYEVQVEYEPAGTEDAFHSMGSIYGMLAPKGEFPRKAGEWESFDITLVGRTVTIVRNGVKTIDRQEIPGITGGALDSREGEPGPFYIQGDHTGGMRYRAIRVAVPRN
jgi:hypothetical protein